VGKATTDAHRYTPMKQYTLLLSKQTPTHNINTYG